MPDFEIAIPEWGPRVRSQPATSPSRAQTLDLEAGDGQRLAATLYRPHQPNGVALLIASAYAVPRAYYGTYAAYMAGKGFWVLSLDYRGIGDSFDARLDPRTITVRQWAERDLAAGVAWLQTRLPDYRVAIIGHSLGGQLPGLLPDITRIAAVLGIAAQSGDWRLRDGVHRLLSFLYFHLFIPVMAHATCYWPGLARGPFAVPAGAALQFARWGRGPVYISDERGAPLREHFERYRGPVRLYHLSDDHDFAPRRAVAALGAFYRNAQVEVVSRHPADWGMARIGHFGFFRSSMARAAWDETANWLLAATQPQRSAVTANSVPLREMAA